MTYINPTNNPTIILLKPYHNPTKIRQKSNLCLPLKLCIGRAHDERYVFANIGVKAG